MYNVEVWINGAKKLTYYLNAVYALAALKKKQLINNGINVKSIYIVKIK